MDLAKQISDLLLLVPESQRAAASMVLADYGPKFFAVAKEDAYQYLRRIMAGDLDAVSELDAALSNDEFVAKVKANTARWENVATYNKVRSDLKNEFLMRLAPIILTILLALVGL